MISPIGLTTVTSPLVVPHDSTADASTANETGLIGANSSPSGDTLELSQPASLAIRDAFRQRFSLKLRSHTELKQSDDGELQIKTKSQLTFRYDFEAADGTTLRLSAKAKLEYTSKTDDDG